MFQGLRWRLLLYQLSVMAVILAAFGAGVYTLFSHSLYRQLDQKLMTLAQAATPSMKAVSLAGENYLEDLDEVPWRDIFNRNRQSLEWFDANGNWLASRGETNLFAPLQAGTQMISSDPPIRAYTISVFENSQNNASPPILKGFIRASQTTQDIQTSQQLLLVGLGLGGSISLLLAGAGGLWLTRISLQPVERNYRQLKQFTADASHELRGPITAIKTSVNVMQQHPERIHPKDEKKLQAIASASQQLQFLTEDLLLLARTNTNNAPLNTPFQKIRQKISLNSPASPSLPIDQSTVSLNECLRKVIDFYTELANAKGLSLSLQAQATVWVAGSPTRYYRLFANLVQNAIDYTQAGQVTVSLSRTQRCAQVQVKDTGIGIASADLPHVFDRFWRADKARTRRAGGSGLGLAITYAIAQQQGGKIWVTSQQGAGSCFYVSLPLLKGQDNGQ
ncbi:MAG: HAMP domain-containing sensor histidine kinase [Phormidesmis sp.]